MANKKKAKLTKDLTGASVQQLKDDEKAAFISAVGDVVPEEQYVKDKEAYQKWRVLMNHPIFGKQRHRKGSDGFMYDLGKLKHNLRSDIAHLPEEERAAIMKLKDLYLNTMNTANVWKRKAFGTVGGKQTDEMKLVTPFPMLECRREEIIELYGRMFTNPEVHEFIIKQFKIPVSLKTVDKFRIHYHDVIAAKIEKHRNEYTDIRLTVKRSRIEELCSLYNRMKRTFEESGRAEDARVSKELLKDIKAEVEADLTINVTGEINIEATVNAHLKTEALRGIGLRQIIIGRVASRMGKPVSLLIEQLSNSYYKGYSGVLRDVGEDVDFTEVKHPTDLAYDFTQIERNNTNIVLQQKNIVNAEIQRRAKVGESVGDKRTKLLEFMAKQKKDVDDGITGSEALGIGK